MLHEEAAATCTGKKLAKKLFVTGSTSFESELVWRSDIASMNCSGTFLFCKAK